MNSTRKNRGFSIIQWTKTCSISTVTPVEQRFMDVFHIYLLLTLYGYLTVQNELLEIENLLKKFRKIVKWFSRKSFSISYQPSICSQLRGKTVDMNGECVNEKYKNN